MYILETENKALYSAQNKARYEAALADVALYQPQAALTFGAEIAAGAGSSATNQYQQNIAVNPLNPKQICISFETVSATNGVLNSQDGGTTWSTAISGNYGDPNVSFDPFGNVYFTFIDNGSSSFIGVKKSTDGGATWGSTVNWAAALDHPSVTIDRNIGSPYYGSIYIAGQTLPYDGHVHFGYSRDQGATWTTSSILLTSFVPPGQNDFGNCSVTGLAALPDGTLIIPMANNSMVGSIGGLYVGVNEVYILRSTDGGATVSVVGLATNPTVPSVFAAVFSGNAYALTSNAAYGPNGSGGARCYVLWSTKSALQESMMMLQTSDDSGATWALPRPIAQLPASGTGSMWVGVNSAGVVGAQFYSLDELGFFTIQFICSLDNGATWSTPVPVTSVQSANLLTTFHGGLQHRQPGGDEVYGCVGPDDRFYCVWSDARSPATVYTTYMRAVAVAAQY